MKTFTIDDDNNISLYANQHDAVASSGNPFESFTSEGELAALGATWPAERLVAIWNSLAGVKPVKGFKSVNVAANRIWERIQHLGEPAKSKLQGKAQARAQVAQDARRVRRARRRAPPRAGPRAKRPPMRLTLLHGKTARPPGSWPCSAEKVASRFPKS